MRICKSANYRFSIKRFKIYEELSRMKRYSQGYNHTSIKHTEPTIKLFLEFSSLYIFIFQLMNSRIKNKSSLFFSDSFRITPFKIYLSSTPTTPWTTGSVCYDYTDTSKYADQDAIYECDGNARYVTIRVDRSRTPYPDFPPAWWPRDPFTGMSICELEIRNY